MECILLNETHLEQAYEIMRLSYERERAITTILPKIEAYPDLGYFVSNAYAFGMVDEDRLIGYICAYPSIDDAFGTTGVKGTFIPIHAHGAIGSHRKKVYDRLYQVLAKHLVDDHVLSHAIALYSHDAEAIESFFTNGFGVRCMDAIRQIKPNQLVRNSMVDFVEMDLNQVTSILSLRNDLIHHLSQSPTFLNYPPMTDNQLIQSVERRNSRIFVASKKNEIIAYIEIMKDGENFITEKAEMVNICGAFCLPEYRNSGMISELLNFLENKLSQEGESLLGVDFESFNPTAREFWLKTFTGYTVSLVRRIDDKQ